MSENPYEGGGSGAAEEGASNGKKPGLVIRALNWVERVGNKLPDPAVLFLLGMLITWVASAAMADHPFQVPVKGQPEPQTVTIQNQLAPDAVATFLAKMVETFAHFHPLGVVLVALLGVGVAERSGFIDAVLKQMLAFTPKKLLTPMLILVAIVSHTAADAGYVLVIPLGGVIFYAAGRHPLAGIAAAFAGVSGGFSANFIPSGIDPLLQGLTQEGAHVLDKSVEVNPLCNLLFTGLSSILIVGVGWYLTDRIVEPRLKNTAIDGDPDEMPHMEELKPEERRGMIAGLVAAALGLLLLVLACLPENSALLAPLSTVSDIENKSEFEVWFARLTSFAAPIMKSIVPMIFLLFLIPGIVHGYISKKFKSHRDVVKGMSSTMSTMGYYLVMAFFASLFIYSFRESKIGLWFAVSGGDFLKSMDIPKELTIVGIIFLCAIVNLFVGSASAKWALLAPVFVPMLMALGISPELTQAAYRVGDSTTNIVTPLMPYFPLVVVFCQRYCKSTGIGTVMSMMIPYSVVFLVTWTIFLLIYWQLGIPLGISAGYTY